jgi:hypothetical protein
VCDCERFDGCARQRRRDLSTARALLATLQDQLKKLQRKNAALRHQLGVVCQRLFGTQSERVAARQLQITLEQLTNEFGAVTEPIEMDSGDTPVRGHMSRRLGAAGSRRIRRAAAEIDVPEPKKSATVATRRRASANL